MKTDFHVAMVFDDVSSKNLFYVETTHKVIMETWQDRDNHTYGKTARTLYMMEIELG
jgi:hypothetical protein